MAGGGATQEQLPDAKARIGGETEFDLFAPNTSNSDLYRPLGKQLPDRGPGVEVFHQVDLDGLVGFAA
jgi:hypothetical protein